MRLFSQLITLFTVVSLSACGGGGGNASAPIVPADGAVVKTVETRIAGSVQNSAGTSVLSVPVTAGGQVVAKLTDSSGLGLANQTVRFSENSTSLLNFPNGTTAVTNSSGTASVKVTRKTEFKFGTGALSVRFDAAPGCTNLNGNTCFASSITSVDFRSDPPSLKLQLLDSSSNVTSSIGSTGFSTVRAILKYEDGTPVVQKKVDLTGDSTKVAFPEGSSQITDSNGMASIKVSRSSLLVGGAGTLSASATISGADSSGVVDSTVVTGALDYTLGVANIGLSDLNVGTSALAAFGNRPISVKATINGAPAVNTAVQITFSASCGVVSPITASTDSNGIATATYTASLAACAGSNVSISASAAGASSITRSISVLSPVATNVQFLSTSPQLIYLKDSVGVTQAQVTFKVIDSIGTPLQNKKIRVSLSNTATGVSLNRIGNSSPVDLTTDSSGVAIAAVFSGTVPTSLNVKATILDANDAETAIFTTSNLLTVASGRPTQRSLSLAFGKLSLEGWSFDGDTTTVSLSMSDRQGNPVPPGTQVNFVAESGVLLPAVCFVPPVIPATSSSPAIPVSSCTVNIRTSGTRPANGRVSVLAYLAGEENFVDANGNNIYDGGESFTDLGRAFRDDNGQAVVGANGQYDSGEFQVPRDGVVPCVGGSQCAGDGVWGAADVRFQGTVIFASSAAVITGTASRTSLSVKIEDINGNSMPTGSRVAVSVVKSSSSSQCAINGASAFVITNTLLPTSAGFSFFDCSPGEGAQISVTSPLGTITLQDFMFP